ncbi:MAG TPA: acyl-CoA dehydrogenase family protein [Aeromicrobium sp.]|nr:acyl-CoA dehydrogenase family protein [Aeromicrobium sp.]
MTADLSAATSIVELADGVVQAGAKTLAALPGGADANQVLAYDLAHAAAAVQTARALLEYGTKGELEAKITNAFVADAVAELASKLFGREELWGVDAGALDDAKEFLQEYRSPAFLAELADAGAGPRHLDEDFVPVQDAFRDFADEQIAPRAESIHRENADIPEDLIAGLAEIGAFGLSIPEEYGGYGTGGESELIGMVVATEEFSRGSLGAGGSLITRPEIMTRALLKGGTEEQKNEWLPKLATTEVMNAIAVTEPDFGSDVANIKVTATRDGDDWIINGVKTWCTMAARADVLLVLARTDPDRSKTHRGLSLFIVPKERGDGHGFDFEQEGGKLSGRAIDTIGYRGMHSYEVSFENWRVGADALVGGEDGLGNGFYYQMAGFENGRLQTAARAVGVMQAAYEAAVAYANDRHVFGKPIADYELTKAKLARMAVIIQAARQFSYTVARLMAKGEGTLEAAMVKAYVCKAAEWVTREAMQIHGGFGYAEEYPVSRYFVDARVLSIFEGADETLCLKVIARRLTSD